VYILLFEGHRVMKKFKLTLFATCKKEYEIKAKDKDEAERKAIEDFKNNIFSGINKDESYAVFKV